MLADSGMKAKWRSVVTTIAYIGSARSFEILRSFMWDRFKGPVDNETWKALLMVPNVMGTIPDTPQSPVIDYLEKGTDPTFWKRLPWTERVHQQIGDLEVVLSEVSINGLSCTGTERAGRILERLRKKPHSASQLSNIKEGIEINEEVRAGGFEAFARRVRTGAPKPNGGGS